MQLGSIRVEVKFAAECIMRFGQGARQVFRFVSLRGSSRSNASTVVVLIGLDRRDLIHAWVIPTAVIGDTDACTLNNPDRAVGDSRSRFSPYRVPFDQLLPEILSAHREHHAQTAQRTRTAALEAQMDALFEVGSA
ncbi:hypothetical protein CQY23_03100 [Mycobacterium celatum]|uniref:Uncharacterized protein n=1 Tax=Mycobacterium celatum TaxID=28045 RepID=A0A2G5PQF4_MYCCE|nr:hypothetical protein CQY23_03100 [Mycobacterium celatum]